MSKKMMLLAAGVLMVFAFTALAGTATAKETKLKCEGAGACLFTVSGGATVLSIVGGDTVSCESVSGSGEVSGLNAERESSTGAVQILFKGCKEQASPFHFACSTAGQASGSVTTNVMTSHGIALPGTTNEAGTLITGSNVTFTCAGGFASTQVTGNVIGESEGKCSTNTGTIHKGVFATSSHGNQVLTTYTGTTNRLEAKTSHASGGTYANTGVVGTATLTFNQNVILTCA